MGSLRRLCMLPTDWWQSIIAFFLVNLYQRILKKVILFFQIFHSIYKDILLRQGKAKTEASPPSKSSFKKCLTRWRWRGKSTKGIFSEQLSLNLIQKQFRSLKTIVRLVRVVEGLRAGESREGHTQRILALMRFGIHKLGSHCKKCQVDT